VRPPAETPPSPAPGPPGNRDLVIEKAPPVTGAARHIALRFSPDRRFLANGKDPATVQAFLLGGNPLISDLRLNLFDSSGTLQPAPLTIREGQVTGHAVLTSSNPGTVTVEFLGSTPAAELEGDKKLAISFMPPITQVAVTASPPEITLADTAELEVTLLDEQGRPLATDTPRPVTLSLQSGRGEIEKPELEIPAGQFAAHTTFSPGSAGVVNVAALTPNLRIATVPLRVSIPAALLICSALGALTGGYLSYIKRKRSGPKRIWIGLVSGLIFYWACLFLGLAIAVRGVVANPLSAFALSTIGGWLQTEVFTAVWGQLKPKT
jgi:hypothetical protein